MNKIAWKSILITFAVSFILGAFYGRWEFTHKMHQKWKNPEDRQDWVLGRLDEGLNLNDEQEAKIRTVLDESAVKMETLREKVYPEKQAIREEARKKIMPVLTTEQQKKYDEMSSQWQDRQKRFKKTS